MSSQYHDNAEESVGLLLSDYKSEEDHSIDAISPPRRFSYSSQTSHIRPAIPHALRPDHRTRINVLRCIWHAVRPQWTAPRQKRKLYPTSWLDGVRGVAALFVVIHHCTVYVGDLRYGLAFDFAHLLTFPFLQVTVSGDSMVKIFFVVSGYCLSYKTIRNARAGKLAQMYDELCSSTFRRSIRLFLPCGAVSFIVALLSYAGYDVHAPREASLSKQLYLWAYDFIQAISPYRVVTNTSALKFGDILWTIPVEFRGSLHVFLILLALGRVKNSFRLLGLMLIQIYLSLTGRWDILLFNSGMICCEIHLIHQEYTTDPLTLSTPNSTPRPPHHPSDLTFHRSSLTKFHRRLLSAFKACWINIAIFLCLAFILGENYNQDLGPFTPLYSYLRVDPPDSWKQADAGKGNPVAVLAAVLLTLQIPFFPQLKTLIFESRFPQYLGEISYALYLTHFILLGIIGDFCFKSTWDTFYHAFLEPGAAAEGEPAQTPASPAVQNDLRMLVWLINMAVLFGPITCWASDLFTRFADRGCIRLAKWVEARCFRP